MKRLRIGCDIGGTFTDGVIMDERSGEFWTAKVPSTPSEPAIAFMRCLGQLLMQADGRPGDVSRIFHGTTVATNAIIEHKTSRAGLITNDGFTDVLEIARQQRTRVFDLQQEKARPLVPGRWRIGVQGRISADGTELVALDTDAVRAAGRTLVEAGVEAVAICFLHSYRNAAHEQQAATVLSEEFPELMLSVSSDIAPLFREYGRVSTAVVNAAIMPLVGRYIEGIERRLSEERYAAEMHIVQSNGGLLPASDAKKYPVRIVESGPAAGVIAAAYLGGRIGLRQLLSFDMGGTTAKVGLVIDGEPQIMPEYEVGASAQTGQYETGAGYPVTMPVIDLIEVGAGGGSIASVDEGGALKSGPRSAGADPGPAAYGRDGVEPTTTDAHVVLGRIAPGSLLGGKLQLREDLAWQAVESRVAEPLGLETTAAALAILEIASSNMLRALRMISAMRGYDPRDYVLVAFGGAGPLHAGGLAEELDIGTVLVPPSPGVASALGMLVTDIRYDYMQTCFESTDRPDLPYLSEVFESLEQRGLSDIASQDVERDCVRLSRSVDLRYRGQAFELTVPAPTDRITLEWVKEMERRFDEQHDRVFGHSAPGSPTEIINLRVSAIGVVPRPSTKQLPEATDGVEVAVKGHRNIWFSRDQEPASCAVYDRGSLQAGHEIRGPAVVEEMDATTLVFPGWIARVDRFGNILMQRAEGAA